MIKNKYENVFGLEKHRDKVIKVKSINIRVIQTLFGPSHVIKISFGTITRLCY